MTTWFGQTLEVQVAFDDSPFVDVDACVWYQVGDDVRGISINRGRTTELANYAPGTAQIILDNRARWYDASNPSGPYYGKLLPMKRIRVLVGTTVIFTGYVLGWPIDYPGMVDSTVTVSCVDGMRAMEQAPLPGSAYEAEVLADSPDYYWPLQALDGFGGSAASAGNYDLSPSATSYLGGEFLLSSVGVLPIGATSGVTYGSEIATLPSGFSRTAAAEFWFSYGGTPETSTQIRIARAADDYMFLGVEPLGGLIYFSYSNPTSNKRNTATISVFTYVYPSKSLTSSHHLVLTVDASNLYLYLDGALINTTALTAGTFSPTFSAGGTPGAAVTASIHPIAHAAFYSTAPNSTRINDHYIAGLTAHGHPMGERTGERISRCLAATGWSVNDTIIETGQTVCGTWLPAGRSALACIREVEATEQGLFYMAKNGSARFLDRQWIRTNTSAWAFVDDGSSVYTYGDVQIDASVADFVRNVVNVSYPNGSVTVKDQTSIDAYLQQSDSVTAQALPNTGAFLARQLGASRLRERKDPKTRVSQLRFSARKSTDMATAAVGIELGDRASVLRSPDGTTDPIFETCDVQGIRHVITRAGEWAVTLYLSPATPVYTEVPYLLMGNATYGKIGAADGNLVPY